VQGRSKSLCSVLKPLNGTFKCSVASSWRCVGF
jgi:hypothetical protein